MSYPMFSVTESVKKVGKAFASATRAVIGLSETVEGLPKVQRRKLWVPADPSPRRRKARNRPRLPKAARKTLKRRGHL